MTALPDPRATRFNILKVHNNPYAAIFDGVIAQLHGAIADLGYACTRTVNEAVPGAVNIIVGPLVFVWPWRGHLLPSMIGRRFVHYQMEPLRAGHPMFDKYVAILGEIFDEAAAIWDYAPSNVTYFRASRWADKVLYLPPAFHRALETFRPDAAPQTDVLFYGTLTERRRLVLGRLAERGIAVRCLSGVHGAALDGEIAQARIVLNLHGFDVDMLETVRISHVLANGGFVISETGDHNPYGEGVVFASYDQLPDTCAAFLGARAGERAKVAAAGYAAVRGEDMTANVRAALARLPIAELTADP